MKKSEKLFNAITDIRDDLISSADAHRVKSGSKISVRWTAAVAAVLVAAIIGGIIIMPHLKDTGDSLPPSGSVPHQLLTSSAAEYALAQPVYPVMAPCPNEEDYFNESGVWDYEGYDAAFKKWRETYLAQVNQPDGYSDGLDSFVEKTAAQYLSGSNGENRIYSPLNIYMALAMLSELTDGQSREQILSLLGESDINALRSKAASLWNANYSDDGVVECLLADSVWLRNDMSYNQETLNTLAQKYYASVFHGEMGSEDYSAALRGWLSEQTGGLLDDQIADICLYPTTLIALASSIYFRDSWSSKFDQSSNTTDVFHSPAGDMQCEFMHQTDTMSCYRGDDFTAIGLGMLNDRNMWLILPDDGVTPDRLLENGEAADFILSGQEWRTSTFASVNITLPKFDVSSQLDLIDGLKSLGVTDIFDCTVSDFSNMTAEKSSGFGYYVGTAIHGARVKIDEDGCIGAAYTLMTVDECAMDSLNTIDFILDRPFIFAVSGIDNVPLFVGVVNEP